MKSLPVRLGFILLANFILLGCYAKTKTMKQYVIERIDPSSITDQGQFQEDLDECLRYGDAAKKRAMSDGGFVQPRIVSIQRDAAIDHCLRKKGYTLLQVGESIETR